MDILLLLMIAVILAPVLHVAGIVLGNSEIRSRGKKVLKAQYMAKREPNKSLAPSVIPAEYMGKLESREKNWEAEHKLEKIWQDAFEWFLIPNATGVLAEAMKLREEYRAAIAPLLAQYDAVYKDYLDDRYGYYSCTDINHAADMLKRAKELYKVKFTPDQEKALAIADQYGWELIDNGIIRSINKGKPLAIDPIVYAL